MKVIDAYWEKRNLGVDVEEILCSNTDTPNELEEVIRNISTPYSVIKIPSGCADLLLTAQKNNYVVVEMTISIEGNIKKVKTPALYNRFMSKVKIEAATNDLTKKVLDEIEDGSIFSTDRIALDPMFSKKIAGVRYANWCKDVIAMGADVEIAFYDNIPVAFNVSCPVKDRKGVYDGLVGGVFSEASNKGLGFLVVQCELESCLKKNGNLCLARVSSNNLPILRLHMLYGYDIIGMNYVLTKHN